VGRPGPRFWLRRNSSLDVLVDMTPLNVKHHLSQPDSDRLMLLLDICPVIKNAAAKAPPLDIKSNGPNLATLISNLASGRGALVRPPLRARRGSAPSKPAVQERSPGHGVIHPGLHQGSSAPLFDIKKQRQRQRQRERV